MLGENATPRTNGSDMICVTFKNRIIPVEGPVALTWGDRMALAERSGRGLASMDGLIAATDVAHQLTLATRNTKDSKASE